jgi:hypothetical protein
MITWQFRPGKLHDGLLQFSQMTPEQDRADYGSAINLIGRWHDLIGDHFRNPGQIFEWRFVGKERLHAARTSGCSQQAAAHRAPLRFALRWPHRICAAFLPSGVHPESRRFAPWQTVPASNATASGQRVSTAVVESRVNRLIGRRKTKKQPMRWSERGAQDVFTSTDFPIAYL